MQNSAGSIVTQGSDETLDVASWNLDWFGDSTHGPSSESLQLDGVRAVIAGTNADIWGLVEVVGTEQWAALTARLPGYSGILTSDSNVADGSRYYDEAEQKLGLLYNTSAANLEDARLILTDHETDFAGRPPLQVTLRVKLGPTTAEVVFIVIHSKCCSDVTSWQYRVNASGALKAYLDTTFPTQKVWVIGDFNDDIDSSIVAGKTSPYFNFVTDATHYSLPTQSLSEANVPSTVEYTETIDHHLITNEVSPQYVLNSAMVLRPQEYVGDYEATTSDHYPVLTRYRWGAASNDDEGRTNPPPMNVANDAGVADGGNNVFINEICANEPGNDTGAEFVELVNTGALVVDIGAWTLSDGTGVRHTFAPGSLIDPGSAVVVFAAAAAIPPGLMNALAASTGSLHLGNSGDSVVLMNANGEAVDVVSYTVSSAGRDGVSINRSPDGVPGAPFATHTALSALPSSPGKRADGRDW